MHSQREGGSGAKEAKDHSVYRSLQIYIAVFAAEIASPNSNKHIGVWEKTRGFDSDRIMDGKSVSLCLDMTAFWSFGEASCLRTGKTPLPLVLR